MGEKRKFGTTKTGEEAFLYEISNAHGMKAVISNYGALLISLFVKNKEEEAIDVVLGYDELKDYEENCNYFGAVIGRSGNRIANSQFVINEKTYHLTPNENENNLHSGPNGYHQRIWNVLEFSDNKLSLELESPALDQGYPGNCTIQVTYEVTPENGLMISYHGECDEDTVFNPTNHSYFNLEGHQYPTVLEHTLKMDADEYTPVFDSKSIPTGEFASVSGTPMDFRSFKEIGKEIDDSFEQLQFTGGYDHNYVIRPEREAFHEFAMAKAKKSGITMKVFTDCLGVQFYAGNFISGPEGKGKTAYQKRQGFCLETQFYPNAINQSNFPSPILKKDEVASFHTMYQFGVE